MERMKEVYAYRKHHPTVGWILHNSTGDINFKTNLPRLTDKELEFCLKHESRVTGLSQLRGEKRRREKKREKEAE